MEMSKFTHFFCVQFLLVKFCLCSPQKVPCVCIELLISVFGQHTISVQSWLPNSGIYHQFIISNKKGCYGIGLERIAALEFEVLCVYFFQKTSPKIYFSRSNINLVPKSNPEGHFQNAPSNVKSLSLQSSVIVFLAVLVTI